MKLHQLNTMLTAYQAVFHNIIYTTDKYNIDIPLCGDVELYIIDENDYYGCDFTNDRKMCMLFFAGASNYFPGIWIGDVDPYDVEIDTYSIYIIDLQGANNTCGSSSFGNVKQLSYTNT